MGLAHCCTHSVPRPAHCKLVTPLHTSAFMLPTLLAGVWPSAWRWRARARRPLRPHLRRWRRRHLRSRQRGSVRRPGAAARAAPSPGAAQGGCLRGADFGRQSLSSTACTPLHLISPRFQRPQRAHFPASHAPSAPPSVYSNPCIIPPLFVVLVHDCENGGDPTGQFDRRSAVLVGLNPAVGGLMSTLSASAFARFSLRPSTTPALASQGVSLLAVMVVARCMGSW